MKTAIFKYALSLCVAVTLPMSCIRQYPEQQESTLNIELEADLAQPFGYKRVILNKDGDPTVISIDGTPTQPHAQSEGMRLRFVAEVFDGSGRCVDRHVLPATVDADGEMAHGVYSITLPHGNYTVAAWADYSGEDIATDLYHDTSESLKNLWMNEAQMPSNSADRDAMAGRTLFTNTWGVEHVKINLVRPYARYRFVATDINTYRAKGRSGRYMSVHITCKDFPFMGLDVVEMLPVSWKQSYSVYSDFEAIGSNVNIATDYAFVALNREHGLKVDLDIYEGGEIVNTITNLTLPLMTNRETVIEGLLLTYNYRGAGGMGIDEGFDDKVDIIFPQ